MQFSIIASSLALSGLVAAMPSPIIARAAPAAGAASDSLATFNVLWYNLGLGIPSLTYTAVGSYGTCYNLQGLFAHVTGSIVPAAGVPGCWVYPAANCQGAYTVVGPTGDAVWEGDSQSFICDAPTS